MQEKGEVVLPERTRRLKGKGIGMRRFSRLARLEQKGRTHTRERRTAKEKKWEKTLFLSDMISYPGESETKPAGGAGEFHPLG